MHGVYGSGCVRRAILKLPECITEEPKFIFSILGPLTYKKKEEERQNCLEVLRAPEKSVVQDTAETLGLFF